jgi:hypothetical protein
MSWERVLCTSYELLSLWAFEESQRSYLVEVNLKDR